MEESNCGARVAACSLRQSVVIMPVKEFALLLSRSITSVPILYEYVLVRINSICYARLSLYARSYVYISSWVRERAFLHVFSVSVYKLYEISFSRALRNCIIIIHRGNPRQVGEKIKND